MMRTHAFVLLGALTVVTARAEDNWPQWRGPHLDGSSRGVGLPTTWSESKNVVWKVALPSWSGATPIVWGDKVFVTSPSKKQEGAQLRGGRRASSGRGQPGGPDLLLLCFNKKDGALLWKRTLASDNRLYGKQNMSSPSPVADGEHVWALTGTGVLTAFDMEGEQTWRHALQEEYGDFGLNWGYASSPLLHEGKVIVQVLHGSRTRGPSYLVAYDGKTGKLVWKVERKTDATRECPDAYTTPMISKHNGRTDIVISGADYVTGHNPATGKEIWRAWGLNPDGRGNYRVVSTPVINKGMIYAPSRQRPLLALRAGGSGDVTSSHREWMFDESGGPDVPTPVCDGKYLYLVQDRGLVTCVNAKNGEIVWGPERTAMGTVSASPLLAEGKLYVTNESAVTTVLKAGPKFEVLQTNQLDDGYTLSSIAVSGAQFIMRTSTHLYCIGE